jgi:hypothetical protein
MELLSRRGFIGSLIAFVAAAPAVVRSEILMPVRKIILAPSITERLTRAHENNYRQVVSEVHGIDENGCPFGEEFSWPPGFNPRVTLKPGEMIINPPGLVATTYNVKWSTERAHLCSIEAELGEL